MEVLPKAHLVKGWAIAVAHAPPVSDAKPENGTKRLSIDMQPRSEVATACQQRPAVLQRGRRFLDVLHLMVEAGVEVGLWLDAGFLVLGCGMFPANKVLPKQDLNHCRFELLETRSLPIPEMWNEFPTPPPVD